MNMRFLRLQQNKSQKEIAEELDMPRTKYARYETGESNPDISTLIKIADFYGVSLDYLCGRQNKNFFDVGYVDENDKQVITIYTKLNNENKNLAKGYVKALFDKQDN